MLEPERECVPSRIVFRRAMPLGRSGVAGVADAAEGMVGVVERDARAGGCERRLRLLVGGGLLRDAIAGVCDEVEGEGGEVVCWWCYEERGLLRRWIAGGSTEFWTAEY